MKITWTEGLKSGIWEARDGNWDVLAEISQVWKDKNDYQIYIDGQFFDRQLGLPLAECKQAVELRLEYRRQERLRLVNDDMARGLLTAVLQLAKTCQRSVVSEVDGNSGIEYVDVIDAKMFIKGLEDILETK